MTKRHKRTQSRVQLLADANTAGFGVAILLFVVASGWQTAVARADLTEGTVPNMNIGAEQFPDEDAINLRWEQHWTLETNGAVHRREHRWVKLLNSRPIRYLADPRIDFHRGQDELIIHTARSLLPDGTGMPVQDYSFNLAAPDDVGSWPHYAAWTQQVICFGGVKDNVVLELDYEVVTKPGVFPWLDADLRLDDDYPTVERVVSVTVPDGLMLQHRIDGPVLGGDNPAKSTENGMTTSSWTFGNLPGTPAEPQSFPWQQRCPRLRFSTCTAATWTASILRRVEQAAQPDDRIKRLVESAVEDEADSVERVRKLAQKLRDSFNFVSSPKTFRGLGCRSASDVLRSNYGSLMESGALYAAAFRALGLKTSVRVAVDAITWDEQAPTGSAFAGIVVVAELPDGPVYVHPQYGMFKNPGSFGKHWLLGLDESGKLLATYVQARGEKAPSEIHLTGKVTIDAEGKANGELRVRLAGAFYDPAQLETASQQENLVNNLVGRVLDDFEVTDHSIATLSDDTLLATAKVASKETLKSYGARYLLTLGDGPVFLDEFPLPLDRSYRKTAVCLTGPVRENFDLTIELPEDWAATVVPISLAPVCGSWGRVAQQVETDGRQVRFRRTADITGERIMPDDFAALRQAVNDLRAAQSLHLVCGK